MNFTIRRNGNCVEVVDPFGNPISSLGGVGAVTLLRVYESLSDAKKPLFAEGAAMALSCSIRTPFLPYASGLDLAVGQNAVGQKAVDD